MFGWLLPDDTHHQVLYEGWDRQQYRPRHGKPPIMVRGAYTAATAIGRARVRYLGGAEEEEPRWGGGRATWRGQPATAARSLRQKGACGSRPYFQRK